MAKFTIRIIFVELYQTKMNDERKRVDLLRLVHGSHQTRARYVLRTFSSYSFNHYFPRYRGGKSAGKKGPKTVRYPKNPAI